MKLEKLFTFLWALVLAFAVSFGAVSCVVTAFDMEVSLSVVALWCGFGALMSCVCYSLPLAAVPMATLALISGVLWQQGNLTTSVESLLYRLSRQYDRAYDWGILKLNYLTADDMEGHLWLILCILGVVIAMAVSWAICRRKSALPGALLGFVLLSTCLVVTDTVPKVFCLFLLMFGILMLMLTNTVHRQEEARGNRAALLLAGPVAVGILVLLAFVPPNGYRGAEPTRKLMDDLLSSKVLTQLLGTGMEQGTSGNSVDSGTVNLSTVGVRLTSEAEVLQVLTDYSGKLYLRGRALDRYDGKTWSDSGVAPTELYWPDAPRLAEGGEVMITTRYAHRMLYLPYYVQSRDMSEVSRGLENTTRLTQYSFSCDSLDPENDYYKIYTNAIYDPAQWDLEFARYLHLADSVWDWAEPMAASLTEGEETVFAKAQAIGNYVRRAAVYDTNTYRMPASSQDFVKWFLEESDTGYCVHFASAATVLLQAAGIPARYVTGYTVDATAAYVSVVRAKDAHAWAEYWLPGYGWMVLEATPADLREESPTETGSSQATVPSQPEMTVPEETQPTESQAQSRKPSALWLIPVLIAVIGGIIVQWRLRVWLRRRKLTQGDSNQQALNLWNRLTELLAHTESLPEQALLEIAEKAKFSPHVISPEELSRLEAAVEAAEQLLRKRSVFVRLYHRLVLALY